MPATSIRDLVVHDDDVVVGTHGRSFWILDDITPLRQIDAQVAASDAYLFKPEAAYRYKRDTNTDTPLPPEEPAGQNPPDGAIIDYYLKDAPSGLVTLEILDSANKLVRRFSSDDKPEPVDEKNLTVPKYWVRPPRILSAGPGMQRFVWDLHYPRPSWIPPSYPISAVYRDTPGEPLGPAVLPGQYTVKLTVASRSYTQPLTVKKDPRVKASESDLEQQFALSMRCYEGLARVHEAMEQVRKLRSELKSLASRAPAGALKDAIAELDKKAAAIGGPGSETDIDIMYFAPRIGRPRDESLSTLQTNSQFMMMLLQGADAAPTVSQAASVGQVEQTFSAVLARWKELESKDVKVLNEQLQRTNLPTLN
jgi:hypothetical protein